MSLFASEFLFLSAKQGFGNFLQTSVLNGGLEMFVSATDSRRSSLCGTFSLLKVAFR